MKTVFMAGVVIGVVAHKRWQRATRRYRAAIEAYRDQ